MKGKKRFGKYHAAAAATAHLPQAFCMMADDREMLMLHVCLGQCIARWVNVFKTKREEKKSNSPWASGLSAVWNKKHKITVGNMKLHLCKTGLTVNLRTSVEWLC